MATCNKFVPGSTADSGQIFSYPFFTEAESKEFIESHGKIMFIIRGPPGTGKNTLSEMVKDHFLSAIKCSADDYFRNTFNSSVRTKESLKKSHLYCHQRVKLECKRQAHPIIVSNTHMKKMEMQEYLNFAMEYEYIVIIVSTLDKFDVSPEILAKSNTKGLDVDYFKRRLSAWQDVFPILMGWFLCTDDSFFVVQQLKFALDALLGDERSCKMFGAFGSDTLHNQYKVKTMLCCVAGFMKSSPYELQNYYKSEKVRASYGKSFNILIQAFVVTKSEIFAIVKLNDNLKELTHKSNFEVHHNAEEPDDINGIVSTMQSFSVYRPYNFKLVPLTRDYSKKPKSAVLAEKRSVYLNMHEISFIHLAQKEEKSFSAWKLNILFRESFSSIVDQNKEIKPDKFHELSSGYMICRLHNDGLIINLPKNLNVKTVFTGLYI